jgi:predicted transposase/invertase (TIGR01784 family)
VKVYNINTGHNEDITARSEALKGYSLFVDKIREMEQNLSQEDAIREAITYCVDHNVLRRFLESNGSEVLNMLITEWNWDDAKEAWQEEAREEGREKGREETIKSLLNFGMKAAEIAQALNIPLDNIK